MLASKRIRLQHSLEQVARKYFDNEEMDTQCGICHALRENCTYADSYEIMARVMEELKQCGNFGPYTSTREQWEPRAWMCLFLAEYLKGCKYHERQTR